MLTDEQWSLLEPVIPKPKQRKDGRGRPPRDRREVLDGILWVLRTGAQWAEMPNRYPPYQTCHRYFQQWVRSGVMKKVLVELAVDLRARGQIDLSEEAFVDGSFCGAKKGGPWLERPSAVRGRKSWQLQTAMVFLSPYPRHVLRHMK